MQFHVTQVDKRETLDHINTDDDFAALQQQTTEILLETWIGK